MTASFPAMTASFPALRKRLSELSGLGQDIETLGVWIKGYLDGYEDGKASVVDPNSVRPANDSFELHQDSRLQELFDEQQKLTQQMKQLNAAMAVQT